MQRDYRTQDKAGQYWGLQEPLVMGSEDGPLVRLEGRGSYMMPVEAYEALAVAYLRGRGYLVMPSAEILLMKVEPPLRQAAPPVKTYESAWCKECMAQRAILERVPGVGKLLDCGHMVRGGE